MKKVLFLTVLSLSVLNSVAAQTENRATDAANGQTPPANDTVAFRSRVVKDEKVAKHVQRRPIPESKFSDDSVPAWGNSSVPNFSATNRPSETGVATGSQLVQQTSMPLARAGVPSARSSSGSISSSGDLNPNLTYRVGVGDVLDIRLLDLPSRESTLFTVLKGAVIEYPLVPEPFSVDGLTTQQIAAALAAKIKVIRTPRFVVTVRDYASHAVIVTGLVENPGRKIMRREAMPLYAVLAEALPRPDGFSLTITRANGKIETVAISDSLAMATLVFSGDAVKVNGKPASAGRFLYVGGVVASPGEKEFRQGLTLTQVLLAAGGATSANTVITVARLNSNGFLTSIQYDLRLIQQGKVPDPVLEPGDRIEVTSTAQ